MSAALPDSLQAMFDEAERAHFASLTTEDFMEGWNSAHQREITVESFALVRRRIRRFLTFNEMVLLYLKGETVHKVVPDNMVVLTDRDYEGCGSFRWDTEPDKPLLVIEYVSPGSERKDYEHNLVIYEQDLKIPYYLIFCREAEELTLFRHGGERYETVLPNEQGRCAIPELDMAVCLVEGWVRYWHGGQLLQLPEQLEEHLESERAARAEEHRQRLEAELRSQEADRRRQEAELRSQEADRRRQEAELRSQEAQRREQEAEAVRDAALAQQAAMAGELARLRAMLPPATS